jgi:hypothetical protein
MSEGVGSSRRQGVRCRPGRLTGICFTLALTAFCYTVYVSHFITPLLSDGPKGAGVVCLIVISLAYAALVASFIRTAWSHPGRVPPFFDAGALNSRTEAAFSQLCASLDLPTDATEEMRTRLRVGITSVSLVSSLRYCEACDAYKCQTTHHCSTCGVCVFELDHHCPWVGGCVGRDNHKYFLLFLFYTVICGSFLVASSAYAVLGSEGIKDTLLFCAWIVALAFVLILTPFLVSSAQTVQQNSSTIAKLQLRRVGSLANRFSPAQGRTKPSAQQAPPHNYSAVRVDDDGHAIAVAVPDAAGEGRSPPRGLRRIMGSHSKFPWWFLPVAPVLFDDDDRWAREITQEVEDQVEYHMSTMVQLHARKQQHSVASPPPLL